MERVIGRFECGSLMNDRERVGTKAYKKTLNDGVIISWLFLERFQLFFLFWVRKCFISERPNKSKYMVRPGPK